MDWLMNPIYNVISWVLLRWHELWDLLLPDGRLLGTNWDWVLAIVFLVITVRIVLFPIFVKQIKSQRAMQALAPKMRELQAKHKGDQQTLREEMMKLYQTEKVNPLMGCLPMLLQIPVFFGLFTVLRHINPLQANVNKTQWGWTANQFDSAAAAQLFSAPIPASFSEPAERIAALGGATPGAAKVVAGILVLTMMFTTFVTSRQMIMKTGWQQEPQQRMIQRLMLYGIPFSLLITGWAFPIGVVVYWVTQNLVSLAQQQWVLRKYPPLITAPTETPKSARERAAAATKKEPSAIARFFLVLPPKAKPAGAPARGGWLARLTARLRPGTSAASVTPVESPRPLAPRPGAKPRTVTTAPSPDIAEPTGDDEPEPAKPVATPKPATPKTAVPAKRAKAAGPTKASPAKAVPAKAVPAKAVPPKAASANGGAPAKKASPTQPEPAESGSPAAARTGAGGGAARAGGGGGRTGAPRKSTPRRKGGQPARKGSGKR